MSLDGDHLQRAEEARRQRPSGMVSQIAHGFTNFGISILGAVGGLAQQPLQSMVSEGIILFDIIIDYYFYLLTT